MCLGKGFKTSSHTDEAFHSGKGAPTFGKWTLFFSQPQVLEEEMRVTKSEHFDRSRVDLEWGSRNVSFEESHMSASGTKKANANAIASC